MANRLTANTVAEEAASGRLEGWPRASAVALRDALRASSG